MEKMKKYLDLSFNGDLSFLNDNLNGSSSTYNEQPTTKVMEEPVENVKKIDTIKQDPIETVKNLNHSPNYRMKNGNGNYSIQREEVEVRQHEISHHQEPQLGDRITHLEDMLLNSGRELERFNTMKIALLEMEKEKIISNYKQELIMMILKH